MISDRARVDDRGGLDNGFGSNHGAGHNRDATREPGGRRDKRSGMNETRNIKSDSLELLR